MKLLLNRLTFTHLSTIGELFVDGLKYAVTLEPAFKTDNTKPRAIPAGTYTVTCRHSPRFERIMPHIEGVPGFDGVLIHWGNFPKDTEGCVLVGNAVDPKPDMIDTSRKTFDLLMPHLLHADEITIEIAGEQEEPLESVPDDGQSLNHLMLSLISSR